MTATLSFQADGGLGRFGNALGELGARAPVALSRALNHTGRKAKTVVIRELTKQTGLPWKTIVRAVKEGKATADAEQFGYSGQLSYTLSSAGGDISRKFFNAKETRRGVSAKPRGRRQMFAGTFTHGGRFPNRVGPVMGGHVFRNVAPGHAWRGKAALQNSGVLIPDKMVQGATAAAFEQMMGAVLEARVAHEIAFLIEIMGL